MRSSCRPLHLLRDLAIAALLLPLPALAQDGAPERPKAVALSVGETTKVGFVSATMCDDPSVAMLAGDGSGELKGVGEGKTLCSGETVMKLRQVFEVTVVRASEKEEAATGEQD